MRTYKVVDTTPTTVTIWDGRMDPDHPGMKAGLSTYTIADHEFSVDDQVYIVLRKVEEK